MDPAPDDSVPPQTDDSVAPSGDPERTVGPPWWVPWLVGFLTCGTALVALTTVFPVAIAVLAGYGSTVGAAWHGRARGGAPRPRRPVARATRSHWIAAGCSVLLFTALALLLGSVGLSIDDDHRQNAVAGAVTGGVLLAVVGGALGVVLLAARHRRRSDPGG